MPFSYIKKNVQMYINYIYYKDVVIDQQVVSEAIKFASSLDVINEHYPTFFTITACNAKQYAEYALGHYALNLAADFGWSTFKSILNKYKTIPAAESSAMLMEMGKQAWPLNADIVWSRYPSIAMEVAFNIPRPPLKEKTLRKKTNTLSLISSYDSQSQLIDTTLARLIGRIELETNYDNNRPNPLSLNDLLKRIKTLTDIAVDYNMLHHQNMLHTLHRNIVKRGGILNQS